AGERGHLAVAVRLGCEYRERLRIGDRREILAVRPVPDVRQMTELGYANIVEQPHEVRSRLLGSRRVPDQRKRGGRGECKSFHKRFPSSQTVVVAGFGELD